MRLLIHSTVAVCVAGAIHAIRRAQTARILGIRFPGTAPVHAATIGTPLSAPPAMLVMLSARAD